MSDRARTFGEIGCLRPSFGLASLPRLFSSSLHVAPGIWVGMAPQDSVDSAEERVGFAAAAVAEVVEVEGPDHAAAQTHLLDPFGLEKRHGHGLVGEGLVRIY